MGRGRFITLEGGEGAGKSTLLGAIASTLMAQGRDVVSTREPGGAWGAEAIRTLIVQGEPGRWSAAEEALLLTAARLNHLTHTIGPALARGAWVLSDRYLDSTRAYQGAGGGLDPAKLDLLDAFIDAPVPDLTLILDVDCAIGLARSRGNVGGEDRFEQKDLAFHERVRTEFRAIAAREPHRCVLIDAALSAQAILAQALAAIETRL